jgi:hypothetical protein
VGLDFVTRPPAGPGALYSGFISYICTIYSTAMYRDVCLQRVRPYGQHIHDATSSNRSAAAQYWYVVVAEISYGRTVGYISKFSPIIGGSSIR